MYEDAVGNEVIVDYNKWVINPELKWEEQKHIGIWYVSKKDQDNLLSGAIELMFER